MKVRILVEMHWKLKQSRIHKNGSTWPISMKFGDPNTAKTQSDDFKNSECRVLEINS
jgi:hypothetical protein